jgi:hypothetical protein
MTNVLHKLAKCPTYKSNRDNYIGHHKHKKTNPYKS